MKPWTTACPDWEERIVKGQSLTPLAPLYPDQVRLAMKVFDSLIMVDVAGSPTMDKISKQWLYDFVSHIFGSYDPDTGVRHITEFFLLISKKNGKSSVAAAIMVMALILNWRMSGEFLILAPTLEIANNAFAPARDMIKADPELAEVLHVQDHTRTITHLVTNATLKVVAADNETVGGKKAIGILVDELWIFGKRHNAENMLREATGGLASRPEGFVIYLSTQSDDPPAGVFKSKLEYARAVRDGTVNDPQFLPVLYEFPKAMLDEGQHLLPENFYVTNPNIIDPEKPELGGSVSPSFLKRELIKAQEAGEDSLRGFLAKHLNVQIGLNLRADRWPGAEFWEGAAKRPEIDLDYILDHSEVVTIGIDGGGLDDLLGLCVLGRERGTRKWLAWFQAWAHPSVLTRRKDIITKLKDFEASGDVQLVDRVGDDTAAVADIVWRVWDAGLLERVGLDPNMIDGILDAIIEREVPEEKLIGVSQGWKLGAAIKTSERKLAEGVIIHAGQPMMNWCVANAKVKLVGNSLVITKQLSGSAKIDPLMALFNASSLMALNPESHDNEYDFSQVVLA